MTEMMKKEMYVVMFKVVHRKMFDENRVSKDTENFCRVCFGKKEAIEWAQWYGGKMVAHKDKHRMMFATCDGAKSVVAVFHNADWEEEAWSAVFKVEEEDMNGCQTFGFFQDHSVQETVFKDDMEEHMRDRSDVDSFDDEDFE